MIEINDIQLKYGDDILFEDASIVIDNHKLTAISGPSGS